MLFVTSLRFAMEDFVVAVILEIVATILAIVAVILAFDMLNIFFKTPR